MDKFISIIYLIGVLILIFPSFLSGNNKWKTILTNFAIWVGIFLLVLSLNYLCITAENTIKI